MIMYTDGARAFSEYHNVHWTSDVDGWEESMRGTAGFIGGTILLLTSLVSAQTDTPVIDQRQMNQEQRIDRGIASGQLNQREAARLDREQNRIDRMENRAKADGVVTRRERARIGAAEDRASRDIYREKHDRQGARHR